MGNALTRRLGVSERDLAKLQKASLKLHGVADLLVEAARALDKAGLLDAISAAMPWIAFTYAMPALPAVSFALKLLSRLPVEPDPDGLVYLAATLAYQRSIEQGVRALGEPKRPKELVAEMRAALDALTPAEDMSFATFSFASALSHPFVTEADGFLDVFAQAVGYDKVERRRLSAEVRARFVVNLKSIVSQGSARAKFAPALDRLELGAGELAAFEALVEHGDLQRRLFEEAPALGNERFSLAEVYEDLDCGVLAWGDVLAGGPPSGRGGEGARVDPFDERVGGRHPLVAAVLEKIGDPAFKDAIVVQGVAGAGKSAFTLRLATELLKEGLRPVRVRLRDLEFDRHAGDAIRRAVRLTDERDPLAGTRPKRATPADLFQGGALWSESITYGAARICPYVLLLDGWDEISVSVTEGFRARLDRMLEQVRGEFLSRRDVPVRVVLTGRPATAIGEGSFLRDRTALLTMRPFTADQLESFLGKLAVALEPKPTAPGKRPRWSVDTKRFRPVVARYRKDVARASGSAAAASVDEEGGTGSMDVLGLPLLAHIAVRLLASATGELEALVANPTALYRCLVDLTCDRAGQLGDGGLDPTSRQRLSGDRLRSLLRRTAAAISAHGGESISFLELERRLRLDHAAGGADLASRADDAAENVLAALVVSFYFKGGRTDLGCEFVHKSFREYLFAEAIVEALKRYGRGKPGDLAERGARHADFGEEDPRRRLFRDLAELYAPQWTSAEVAGHVERLIAWEIARSFGGAEGDGPGKPTEALGLRAWEAAREGLADVWAAWCDGVHLRPQLEKAGRGGFSLSPSYAEKLVDWALPQAADWGDARLAPQPTSTVDAHLGDGIFRLAALVHGEIALARGFTHAADGEALKPFEVWRGRTSLRRCQSTLTREGKRYVLFAPSGRDPDAFSTAVQRVGAGGWRPGGAFPLSTRAPAVDLAGACFTVPEPQTPPRATHLRHANLEGVVASGSSLPFVDLEGALMKEAILDRVDLLRANLARADLDGASLVRADLASARILGANLSGVDLTAANVVGVIGDPADWLGAKNAAR